MITAKLIGDANVQMRLQMIGLRTRENLRAAVTRGAIMLTRYVKEEKLSGQVLKNRTGTLRRKINYEVAETATGVTGAVGVKLSYAAAHEYGFDGVVSVREHLRRVKSRDVTRGRYAGLGEYERAPSKGIGFVGAHTRHMHLPERSFLRSSLRENVGSLTQLLRTAVLEARL